MKFLNLKLKVKCRKNKKVNIMRDNKLQLG